MVKAIVLVSLIYTIGIICVYVMALVLQEALSLFVYVLYVIGVAALFSVCIVLILS